MVQGEIKDTKGLIFKLIIAWQNIYKRRLTKQQYQKHKKLKTMQHKTHQNSMVISFAPKG